MVLKPAFAAVTCALWLAGGSAWAAEDYRPGEYLKMDLSQAVMSPKRLGPPAEFAPVAIEARTDTKQVASEPVARTPKVRVAQPRVEKPRAAARTKLAHRRSNPLDANAMDTRTKRPARTSVQKTSVQAWPCKSGGICNWKR
jgi:hypothetical protein